MFYSNAYILCRERGVKKNMENPVVDPGASRMQIERSTT